MSDLPEVAGRRITRSLNELERAARVQIAEQQESPACDNALVAVLCDTVRLCREHADYVRKDCGIVCRAGQEDGVSCPEDECDRENGVRP